jgi:hypothetical protein
MLRPGIRWSNEGFRDAFEEVGIPWRFIGILDDINSTLVIAGRYRLPSVIVRTLVYDSISGLDDFVRGYRGYVSKVMNHVCEELRSLLYEVLEEGEDF